MMRSRTRSSSAPRFAVASSSRAFEYDSRSNRSSTSPVSALGAQVADAASDADEVGPRVDHPFRGMTAVAADALLVP
jgi:hypothetical protein